jgi:hypothetical protein
MHNVSIRRHIIDRVAAESPSPSRTAPPASSGCCAAWESTRAGGRHQDRVSLQTFIQQFGGVMSANEVLARLNYQGRNDEKAA